MAAAVWHFPAILGDGPTFRATASRGLGMMIVFSIPFSIVMTWLRLRTKSLLAPIAAHAAFDVMVAVSTLLTWKVSGVIAAPMGLLGAVPFCALAVGWSLPAGSRARRRVAWCGGARRCTASRPRSWSRPKVPRVGAGLPLFLISSIT